MEFQPSYSLQQLGQTCGIVPALGACSQLSRCDIGQANEQCQCLTACREALPLDKMPHCEGEELVSC